MNTNLAACFAISMEKLTKAWQRFIDSTGEVEEKAAMRIVKSELEILSKINVKIKEGINE